MSDIKIFSFEANSIRTIVDAHGEPWFVGKDVAEALGYARPNDALQQHCKGAVKRRPLQTAGGIQEVRIINEPDMLRLIVNSKLPSAQKFERWVFEDVLPTIRKTGAYSVTQEEAIPQTYAQALLEAGRLALQVEQQEAALALAAPKVQFVDSYVQASTGSLGFRQVCKLLGVKEPGLIIS